MECYCVSDVNVICNFWENKLLLLSRERLPSSLPCWGYNIMRTAWNGQYFPGDDFKYIFVKDHMSSDGHKFVLNVSIDNKSSLVQAMAWHRIGHEPPPDTLMTQFTMVYIRNQAQTWKYIFSLLSPCVDDIQIQLVTTVYCFNHWILWRNIDMNYHFILNYVSFKIFISTGIKLISRLILYRWVFLQI